MILDTLMPQLPSRVDSFYRNFQETENLSFDMLAKIEDFAWGLEMDEIFDYFGAKVDFEAEEIKWMERAFRRGRAIAKKQAVDNLFSSMKDRNGQNASLPYLRRFADKWPGDDNVKEGDVLIFRANTRAE